MKQVIKFDIVYPVWGRIKEFQIPYKATICHAEYNTNSLTLSIWMLVDHQRDKEIRRFAVVPTGDDLGPYVNDFKHIASNEFWHIFEVDIPVTPQ